MPVKYPFGYGLSYTTFSYQELEVAEELVCFKVKNTGHVSGAEIAQVYISCKDKDIFFPVKELRDSKRSF